MTCSAHSLHRRTIRAQLRSLVSMLFLNMKHDATDRFMRDAICGCYSAERFLLLHHTLQDSRPQVSWTTIVWLFRPWSSALEKRRVPTLNEFISRQKVLHLQIQFPRRGKEEVKNWRKRIRHPSVPSKCFQLPSQQASCVYNGFDLSNSSFPLWCLSSDGSRLYPSIADSTSSVPLLNRCAQ